MGDLAEAIFESEEVFENVISSVSSTENNIIFSEYSMKKQEMHNIQAEINSVSEQAQSSGILNKLGLNLKLMGFRRNLAMAQKSFSQFKLTATAQLFDSGSFMHNSEFHGNVATKVEAFSQQCRITADLTEEKNSLSAKLADCDAQLNILLEGVPAIAKTHSLKKEINDCKEILKNLLGTEGTIYVQNLIDEEGVLSKKAKSDKFFSDLEQIAAQKQKIASLKRQILIENHTAEVEAASKKIENLNKSISENTNRIKYLTEENADFALKITSLEESIKVFNSQIAKLQAKEKEAKSKNGKKSS